MSKHTVKTDMKARKDVTLEIFVTPYKDPKQLGLLGFANVKITSGEQNTEIIFLFDRLTVRETKKGVLYLMEPTRNYQDKNKEWQTPRIYMMPKDLKLAVEEIIVKNNLLENKKTI